MIRALRCAAALLLVAGCTHTIEPGRNTSAGALPEGAKPIRQVPAGEAQSSVWTFGGYEGQLIESTHYRIHTTVESTRFRRDVPRFFEGALSIYATAITDLPLPSGSMDTFLFADSRQWQAKTRELLPQQADQFSNLGRGGYTTRGIAVLFYLDRSDTWAIAAHEGWHQYTQNTFRDALPVWLEEGIATYMEPIRLERDGTMRFEPERNFERWYTLRRAVRRDRLIPLDELLIRSPQEYLGASKTQLLTYYSQVWALTLFLMQEQHRDALEDVLADAASGRLMSAIRAESPRGRRPINIGPALVSAYFADDLNAFESEYHAFVRELAGPRRYNGGRR